MCFLLFHNLRELADAHFIIATQCCIVRLDLKGVLEPAQVSLQKWNLLCRGKAALGKLAKVS